jgi:hypothetical protein
MSLSGGYTGLPKDDILMSNLDYGFSLHWAESFRNPKDFHLRKIIDFAVTWGIIEEKSFDEQLSIVSGLLRTTRKVKASAYLKMKEGLFDSLIDPIVNLSDYAFQQALAASVPYANYDGRQTPSTRKQFYFSFFNLYLREKSGTHIDYGKVTEIIVDHLNKNEKLKLAQFESTGDNKYVRLENLLEHNFMAFRFNNFKTAIALLNDQHKDFKSVIQSSAFLRNLNWIRLQPEFNMRFLGRLLLELSIDKGIHEVVERSLVLEYNEGDKEIKHVIAR